MAGLSLSARNTFTLLGNLLEWAQMAQGLTDFKPQKLELTRVITECIAVLEESAKGKAIQLSVQIVDEPIVFADKNMLQSVIRNLISNAIKFTPTGGEISISTESSANNMTVIFVRDTGIGMTDEMLNNLFRIDANTKRPGTNGEKSTGLGLLLCKEFVGKLGGKITVESEPNKGTVFSFNIPAMERDEKELVVQKDPLEERYDHKIENLNILIAEDDEISMKLISLYVDEFSKQVYSVKTGTDAVKVCHDNQDIDLVLMDIAMPNMDGFEASRQIREFNKTVIIIAQTSYIFANNKEKALAAGFNDYIIKPISKPALIEIIKKHIKR
jgi:CheY-like chemotaxis protein